MWVRTWFIFLYAVNVVSWEIIDETKLGSSKLTQRKCISNCLGALCDDRRPVVGLWYSSGHVDGNRCSSSDL
jgi:hypothetical protein